MNNYYDEKGNLIEDFEDGYLFINGSIVSEPGTDRDFDRYSIEVQNGDGYYLEDGQFCRYHE